MPVILKENVKTFNEGHKARNNYHGNESMKEIFVKRSAGNKEFFCNSKGKRGKSIFMNKFRIS